MKGKGIVGKLTVFKRADGKFQAACAASRCTGSRAIAPEGQANGEGIVAFGGTWHAMPAAGY